MRDYELTVLLQDDISDEALEQKKARLAELCAGDAAGAESVEIDDQSAQSLSYEINHYNRAHYLLLSFKTEPARIAELETKLRLDEEVLRHLVIRRED